MNRATRSLTLSFVLAVIAVTTLMTAPRMASSYEFSEDLIVFAFFQGWFIAYEQMEDAQGLFQHPSGEEAVDHTTGFRLHRLRLGAYGRFHGGWLSAGVQVKLEDAVGLLDGFVGLHPTPWLAFRVGQYKVPSTAENLTPENRLDFIVRSEISRALADYSLSRTRYASSLFYGNVTYGRDFGVGLIADGHDSNVPLRLFTMVGNGLGANLFISGDVARGFLITNGGQLYYGVRVESAPLSQWLRLGGHFSYNRHDNVVFNSGRVVLDLDRMSGSGDLSVEIESAGVRFGSLGGYGVIREDANLDGREDFQYGGVVGWAIWNLAPMLHHLTDGGYPLAHRIQLGGRYEFFSHESDEAGEWTDEHHVTLDITYAYRDIVKVQLEALLHTIRKPFFPDLDDNAFIVSFQAEI